MGLYVVTCPQCGVAHQWFSGNRDQRCSKCMGFPVSSTSSQPAGENILATKTFPQEALQCNTQPLVGPLVRGPYIKVKQIGGLCTYLNTDKIETIDVLTAESNPNSNYVGTCIVRFETDSHARLDKESTDKLLAFLGLEYI